MVAALLFRSRNALGIPTPWGRFSSTETNDAVWRAGWRQTLWRLRE